MLPTPTRVLTACLIGVAGLVLGFVIARAQAPEKPPTIDELRKAVADLRGGRIPRPQSYDAMTADQQEFVKSVLSGPRGDISGSLGVMIVSPTFADLAQKTIAYARFAGREGYSVVTPKLTELAIIMGAPGPRTMRGTSIAVRPSAPALVRTSSTRFAMDADRRKWTGTWRRSMTSATSC